jgi:hypothetical protein
VERVKSTRASPSKTGPLDCGGPEASNAPHHVDNPAAGQIDDSDIEQVITVCLVGAQPAIRGPNPVGNDRVDKAGQERGVDQVGLRRNGRAESESGQKVCS